MEGQGAVGIDRRGEGARVGIDTGEWGGKGRELGFIGGVGWEDERVGIDRG